MSGLTGAVTTFEQVNVFLPWRLRYPEAGDAMRRAVPSIAAEQVEQIRREMPEYVRPHDARYAEALELSVRYSLGQFVELVNDPDTPVDDVLAFFHKVGSWEAKEGRELGMLHAAIRLGTRVAIRRLSEAAAAADPDIPPSVYGEVTGAIFPYLDALAEAAERGYEEVKAEAGIPLGSRRRLLDLLVSGAVCADDIMDHAKRAAWPLPTSVAAVALDVRPGAARHRPLLGPDVLTGLHLAEPCLIVPDPEGPGRPAKLAAGLAGWDAAIGPAVPVAESAMSLGWARQALRLAQDGVIAAERPVIAVDHMPTLVIMRSGPLVSHVVSRRLQPLERTRPKQRRPLAETLLACLECGFNATEVASRMALHPQTVRYRLRKLEELFGAGMQDPALCLEFQIVLHAWLAANPAAAVEGTQVGE